MASMAQAQPVTLMLMAADETFPQRTRCSALSRRAKACTQRAMACPSAYPVPHIEAAGVRKAAACEMQASDRSNAPVLQHGLEAKIRSAGASSALVWENCALYKRNAQRAWISLLHMSADVGEP